MLRWWFGCLLLLPAYSFAQRIKPEKVAKLPPEIRESSGICMADSTAFWTINDSGGGSALYLVNENGELITTRLLNGSSNHDWEDLAADSGFLFIGDFGNNLNMRTELEIYKIHRSYASDSDHFMPGIISFSFPDQSAFPPAPSNWNYDCEALIHFGDSLYLFSKNLSNPSNGFTKVYRLPDREGNFRALLIDSFSLHEPVTGAAVSPDGNTVVLLTYFSLWVLLDFPGDHFFSRKVYQFPMKGFSQKESICFRNNHQLLMTDEHRLGRGGNLYTIDLNELDFAGPYSAYKKQHCKQAKFNAFNNPKKKFNRIRKREVAE